MKKLILLSLLLSGCATVPPQSIQVKVPVPVPCHAPTIPVPDWALDHLSKNATLYDQVKAMIVEIEQRRAYEAELEAAVKACE